MKDVLIVGAGPSGLVLASQLAQLGIYADIIEKKAQSVRQSKALSISSATLKALHGLGVVDQVIERGNQLHDIFVHFNNQRVAHIDMRHIKSPYNFYLTIPQPDTEKVLESYLNNQEVFVKYQCALQDFSQDQDGVTVTLDNEGIIETERYRYIVGCDGSRSQVRSLLGCDFSGYDYDMYFIMADVKFATAKTYDIAHYYVDKEGFLIFLPMRNGLTRIVIKKSGQYPSDSVVPQQDELQAYLNKYVPFQLQISEIIWRSSAPFYCRLTESNKFSRVFLAGDSYHLFSPIGGQGMNTGIQDSLNLGWKLAYVLKGYSDAFLLQSYAQERMYAVKMMQEATHVNTLLISRQWTGKNDKRSKMFRYLPMMKNRKYYKEEMANEFSGLLSYYHEGSSLNGKHVPFVQYADMSTYDVAKVGKMVLFVKQGFEDEVKHLQQPFAHVLQLKFVLPTPADALQCNTHFCLVRPDGYVALHQTYDQIKKISAYLQAQFMISAVEKKELVV